MKKLGFQPYQTQHMINPIKPNIGLWISSEPSPVSLQIDNFAGSKLSAVCVNQTNLNVKLSTKLGGHARGQTKIWGQGPPRPPLEPPLGNTRTKYNQLPAIIWNFC